MSRLCLLATLLALATAGCAVTDPRPVYQTTTSATDGVRTLALTPHLRDDYPAVVPEELSTRREELAHARATLAVAVERRNAARRDVERLSPLAEQSLVSRQQFDYKRTELSVAEGEAAKAIDKDKLYVLENGRATLEAGRASSRR